MHGKGIIQLLKLRFVRGIIKYPLIIFWRLKLDWILSGYIALTIFLFNYKKLSPSPRFARERGQSRNPYTILVMDRGIFDDDVAALQQYSMAHNLGISFIHINSYYRRTLEKIMLPQELRNQIEFYQHLLKHRPLSKRIYYIQEKVLDFLECISGMTVAAFLSGNINYAQDYHWIKTMQNRGKLFIALNKESIIYSPNHALYRISLHKEQNFFYEGDFALFYNERGKETYVRAGAVLAEKSIVIGSPKVDNLVLLTRKSNVPQTANKFILLLSFDRPLVNKSPKLWRDVIETIVADPSLALQTIVKCRNDKEAQKLMMEFPSINAVSGSLQPLLEMRPALAVGFNSASCLDVLITGIPLLIPLWQEAESMSKDDILLGEHTKNFHLIARNKETFLKYLKEYLEEKNNGIQPQATDSHLYNEELKKFIEHYYSPLDGKNCQRFFEFLQVHI